MFELIGEGSLSVSTSEAKVISACRIFYAKLLRIEPGIEEIVETEKEFPDEVPLQMACALLWLFGQTPEAQARSAEYLEKVKTSAARLNRREAAWLDAMEKWHAGSFEAAANAFEAITTQWPEDLPAAKAAEFIYYILGQHASGRRFLSHMQRLTPVHSEDADFLAMKAFAHELCGEIGEATEAAEHALDIAPFNPWAQHALEHVLGVQASGAPGGGSGGGSSCGVRPPAPRKGVSNAERTASSSGAWASTVTWSHPCRCVFPFGTTTSLPRVMRTITAPSGSARLRIRGPRAPLGPGRSITMRS